METSLLIYERCFAPLDAGERERYYQEQQRFARACGVPDGHWPEDIAAFERYYARMLSSELRVTPSALAVARAIAQPRLPRALRPAMAPNTLITVGLLPPSCGRSTASTGARRASACSTPRCSACG